MKANKFHTFKYNAVLNAENLDKLEENYTIYEEEIAKLKEHINKLLIMLIEFKPKNKG